MTIHRRHGMIAFGLLPAMGPFKVGLGLLVILVGSIVGARTSAKRTMCLMNLRAMGKCCQLYMTEHNDAFPPNLNAFIQQGNDPRLLECPSSPLKGPSYFYLSYLSPTGRLDPSAMVACDYYCNHAGIRNVLFSDGHAEVVKDKRFAEALTWPVNTRFAQALAAAEGSLRAQRAAHKTP